MTGARSDRKRNCQSRYCIFENGTHLQIARSCTKNITSIAMAACARWCPSLPAHRRCAGREGHTAHLYKKALRFQTTPCNAVPRARPYTGHPPLNTDNRPRRRDQRRHSECETWPATHPPVSKDSDGTSGRSTRTHTGPCGVRRAGWVPARSLGVACRFARAGGCALPTVDSLRRRARRVGAEAPLRARVAAAWAREACETTLALDFAAVSSFCRMQAALTGPSSPILWTMCSHVDADVPSVALLERLGANEAYHTEGMSHTV